MAAFTPVPLRRLLAVFGKIGLINFGGPAGQIALMHRMLVEEAGWIDEAGFLRALNFCALLPGPEAQQLAAYIGWRLRGTVGGLIAGLLFILPGAGVMLALSLLYAYAGRLAPVEAAFLGVKAAVLAIVVQALIRLSSRVLNNGLKRAIAALALVALFLLHAPFPLVIVAAAIIGLVAGPKRLAVGEPALNVRPPAIKTLVVKAAWTAVTWLALWLAPLAALALVLGPQHPLVQLSLFFGKMSVVSFGGAYAVLTYVAQQAVSTFHWVTPREMVDGLGLAETTPGPLILTTQFVGFLAAFRDPTPFPPLVAGLLSAVLTLWMTFTPCFLWIFVGAPFVERLEHFRGLQAALSGISSAVVGVIANLALWFGLQVLFHQFGLLRAGGWSLEWPLPGSADWAAIGLSLIAALLLLRFKVGVVKTLGICLVLSLGLHALNLA